MARLARAAVVGLFAALALAAIVLLTSAVRRLRAPCQSPAAMECALEAEVAQGAARREALAAFGCLVASLGLGRLVKPSRRAAAEPGTSGEPTSPEPARSATSAPRRS